MAPPFSLSDIAQGSVDAARAVADQHAAETLLNLPHLLELRRPAHAVEPVTWVTVALPDVEYGLMIDNDGTSWDSLSAELSAAGCAVVVQGADGAAGLIILDGDELRRLGLFALGCADALGVEVGS